MYCKSTPFGGLWQNQYTWLLYPFPYSKEKNTARLYRRWRVPAKQGLSTLLYVNWDNYCKYWTLASLENLYKQSETVTRSEAFWGQCSERFSWGSTQVPLAELGCGCSNLFLNQYCGFVIRTTVLRIRILLFSSVADKMPTQDKFYFEVFFAYYRYF